MKLANIGLALTKGHEVHLNRVTPAEVLFLVAEHHQNYGGDPIVHIEELKDEVKKTNEEELDHLKQKYSARKLAVLFPGSMPNMPDSFAKARELGVKMVLPTQKLMEARII